MGDAGSWKDDIARVVRLVSATIAIGALTGAVIGGLGGRLAMRVLFLTTGDKAKGVTSDDGFTIGQFTLTDTIGLVVLTTVLGMIAALLYLGARPFLVQFRFTVPVMALFYGVVGGALLVNPDGVDFTLLEPAALAIAMFVAIFAAFGAIVARFVDAAARNEWGRERPWWLVGLPLVVMIFPPLLIVAVVVALLQMGDVEERSWRVLRAGALTTMSGIFALSALNLADDVATLV